MRRLVALPAGRDLDLDAQVVARPGAVLGDLRLGALLDVGRLFVGVAAAQHGPRAGVLAHEPQAAAAAREQLRGDLLEVLGGGGEGLLEGLLDPPVGVADQPAQLAQRVLEVLALGLELLDVRERLLVLVLRERVDRAELLAAALQALDAALQLGALGVGERLGGGLGLQAQPLGEAAELLAGVGGLRRAPAARGPRRA